MAKRLKTRVKTRGARQNEGRLPTREDVLAFIESSQDRVGKREIARHFQVKGGDRKALKELIGEMTADGLLVGNRKSFTQPGHLPPVAVLEIKEIDRAGDLIAEPAVWDNEAGERPRVVITHSSARGEDGRARQPVGPGDRALVRLERLDEVGENGALYEGRVIRRLVRETRRLLGIYRDAGPRGGVIEPVERKALKSWSVNKGDENGAKDGDLVEFDTQRTGHRAASARVLKVLGNPDDQRQVSLIAVHAHGLPVEFPEPVLEELATLGTPTLEGREDLRDLPLITIDPADARDHDDAVYACPDDASDNEGGHVVIVAIADVSFYVRPGSRLDREAQLRANSIYFPDRVVPMLPEKISNDLCSLKEGKDRPCLAVRMVFDRSGAKKSHTFMRAMMRSHAGLSYQDAQAAFDGEPGAAAAALMEPALTPLWAAYQALAKGRDTRQPLELDLPERRVRLDEAGRVAGIDIPDRLDAHRLIEEFMIQANVAAAESLENAHAPVVYRAHEKPSREKLKGLSDFLETLDLRLPKAANLKPQHFNTILRQAKLLPVPELVNEVILRSQAQAEYATENAGHFGLNLRRYAHFTSPIRRYADLLVHRSLIRALKLGPGGLTDDQSAQLATIAQAISVTERKAMAAERETMDRLMADYLSEQVGAEFKGRISGVTTSGLFVRLAETGADGFIPASTLGDDYYHYVEAQHALVGDRHQRAYRLGDAVDVRLVEALPFAGALRFEMLSEGRTGHVSLAKGWRSRGRTRTRGPRRR